MGTVPVKCHFTYIIPCTGFALAKLPIHYFRTFFTFEIWFYLSCRKISPFPVLFFYLLNLTPYSKMPGMTDFKFPPCPVYVLRSNCFQHTVYIVHPFRQPGCRPRQSVGADCPCQKGEADEALPLSNEQHQHTEQEEGSCNHA